MSAFQISLDCGPFHFSIVLNDDEHETELQRESAVDAVIERAEQHDDSQVRIGFRP